MRVINEKPKSHLTRSLEEVKTKLNSQISAAITTAITKNVIPELQGSIGALENGLNAKLDLQFAPLHRNTENILTSKNTPKQLKRKEIELNSITTLARVPQTQVLVREIATLLEF